MCRSTVGALCRSLEGAGGSIFSVQHLCSSPARFYLPGGVCWIVPSTWQLSWKSIKREHCHREKPSFEKALVKAPACNLHANAAPPVALLISSIFSFLSCFSKPEHVGVEDSSLLGKQPTPLGSETCSLLESRKGCVHGQSSGQH